MKRFGFIRQELIGWPRFETGACEESTANGRDAQEQIFRAVDDVGAHFGKIDILVNDADIAPENLAENIREEDFEKS